MNRTYQDWLKEPEDKRPFIEQVIVDYKGSADFNRALEAQAYFNGSNIAIGKKTMLKVHVAEETDDRGKTIRRAVKRDVAGARIPNGFFRQAVMQETQYLLSNGVTLDDSDTKAKLGIGFDNALEQIGEKACVHGVCYGFWNVDHLEVIPAAVDALTGCVALVDEINGTAGVVIQFWQINRDRPQYVRVFEHDGVTVYSSKDGEMRIEQPKRAYKQTILTDAIGSTVTGEENYSFLPVVPMYANNEKRSELTVSIKEKVDAYDRIISDFSDNLDRANDVYWALNNFGGSLTEALQTQKYINELKMVINQTDGSGGGGTAEPHTIEVPYAARKEALALLRKELYADFMALDMDALTGGSLTNVAIRAAMANLNLKADRFEWHAFAFVQSILRLLGIETENITFKRQTISNDMETIQAIYAMRSDIDLRTALELNPYINQDDIEKIIDNIDAESASGISGIDQLKETINKINQGDEE